jgi:hypothetical protein
MVRFGNNWKFSGIVIHDTLGRPMRKLTTCTPNPNYLRLMMQATDSPPKSANEIRTPQTPPISDEFVSVQKVVAAEVAQGLESAKEFAREKATVRYTNNLFRPGRAW